jgi:hypothetical protein
VAAVDQWPGEDRPARVEGIGLHSGGESFAGVGVVDTGVGDVLDLGAEEASNAGRGGGLLSTFSTTAARHALEIEEMGASGQLDDAPSTLDGLIEMVGRLAALLDDLSIEG